MPANFWKIATGSYPRRVGRIQSIFMLLVAGAIDGLQILLNLLFGAGLIINRIISIIMALVFGAWFFLNQVSYWNGRQIFGKLTSAGAGAVIEMIPVIDSFPVWVGSVGLTIFFSWLEDFEKHQEKLAQEQAELAQLAAVAQQEEANELAQTA